MSGRDRRERWRLAVYARRPGMTDPCRVLLLRMLDGADGMNANGVVSIPRSRLAKDLGIPPARISERIQQARKAGLLDVVRYGSPGVTAVYQATIPDDQVGTPDVPQGSASRTKSLGTSARKCWGTPDVPQNGVLEVRHTGTHCVGNLSEPRTDLQVVASPDDKQQRRGAS